MRHGQPELLVDVIIIFGGLVASAAGTVEGRACADARRRYVAAVLAGDRVAGPAIWGWYGAGDGL